MCSLAFVMLFAHWCSPTHLWSLYTTAVSNLGLKIDCLLTRWPGNGAKYIWLAHFPHFYLLRKNSTDHIPLSIPPPTYALPCVGVLYLFVSCLLVSIINTRIEVENDNILSPEAFDSYLSLHLSNNLLYCFGIFAHIFVSIIGIIGTKKKIQIWGFYRSHFFLSLLSCLSCRGPVWSSTCPSVGCPILRPSSSSSSVLSWWSGGKSQRLAEFHPDLQEGQTEENGDYRPQQSCHMTESHSHLGTCGWPAPSALWVFTSLLIMKRNH